MKQSSFLGPLHRESASKLIFKKRDRRPRIVVGPKERRQQYVSVGEKLALVIAL
jgi:hypothetical protein